MHEVGGKSVSCKSQPKIIVKFTFLSVGLLTTLSLNQNEVAVRIKVHFGLFHWISLYYSDIQ